MSKKQIVLILVICLVLLGIFISLDKKENQLRVAEKSRVLFADLKADKIAQINLGSADGAIELELMGDSWGVASRDSYPADVNHVRSLLLNVLDLNVSQKITSNAERYEALGVADNKFIDQLTFFNSEGKPLGGLLLGNQRERTIEGGPSIPAGQYVRRVGEKEVYLAAQKIDLQKDVFYWLDANISNFLASKLESLKQQKVVDGKDSLEFELKTNEVSKLELVSPEIASDEIVDESYLSKISTALENCRLQDVFKASDERIQNLNFDFKTTYQGKNGLIYTVFTAARDEKYYARFQVEFNKELLDSVKEKIADKQVEPSESLVPSVEPSEVATEAVKKKEQELATEQEASTLNARYHSWVYELPEYQAKKFRVLLAELVKKSTEAGE